MIELQIVLTSTVNSNVLSKYHVLYMLLIVFVGDDAQLQPHHILALFQIELWSFLCLLRSVGCSMKGGT